MSWTLLGAIAASVGASAQSAPLAGRCALKFFGSSTLHDFEGHARCEAFAIEPVEAGGVYRSAVAVEVAEMSTDLGGRDARMREMFDAEHFPRILASFDRVSRDALRAAAAGPGPALPLAFRLAIRDTERRIVPRLSAWREDRDGSLQFLASFELSLREFELEAPTVMGLIEVDDRVRVEVEVSLLPLAIEPGSPPARPRTD